MRRIVRTIAALGALVLPPGIAPAAAQSSSSVAPGGARSVLDVPYLPQSELLCGGAAVAMVERWLGRRGVYAEDFAGLVRAGVRGIRTTDLAAAARARGWDVQAFDGTPDAVRRWLGLGVPVVALIEVARDRFHYVVLLGWADGRVDFHDPAIAPSRSISESQFLSEWSGAERWAMVLRRTTAVAEPLLADALPAMPVDSMPCRPWIDRALDAVAARRLEEAESLLGEAGHACPDEPMVTRELAGVRFKQGRVADAVRLSAEYAARVPGDDYGWTLLATSRYVAGDRDGALRAWNHVGLPVVDLVRVDGVRDMRFAIVDGAVALAHGRVLTPADLALARRRVADLGAVRRSSVEYQPVEGGRVEVRVAVAERATVSPTWQLLGTNVITALTQHTVGVTIATPTGAGELWTAEWRWEHAHPRLALGLNVPARIGVSGLLSLERVRERFRLAVDTANAGVLEESRSASVMSFGGWVIPALRPYVGLGFERWSGGRAYLDASAGVEFRAAGDRLVINTSGEYARALADHPSWTRGDVRAQWLSSAGLGRRAWSARIGLDLTDRSAPLGVRPMASGNGPWVIPLRAHPRTFDGLLPGATAGQGMLHGGLSGEQPVLRAGLLTFALGLFVDAAEVTNPVDGAGRRHTFVDAGGGIRIGLLDGQLGVVRVDLARGITDHRSALTVGLHERWPPIRSTAGRP